MTHALAIERRHGMNPWTVALSLASNRASKIAKLRADNTERCTRIADNFEASLREDVESFLAKPPTKQAMPPAFRRALHEAAGLVDTVTA